MEKTEPLPTSGMEIGLPIDHLIERIKSAKPIMMSDREYMYLLSRVDELKNSIVNIRRWGL